jgi:hypothetical protein
VAHRLPPRGRCELWHSTENGEARNRDALRAAPADTWARSGDEFWIKAVRGWQLPGWRGKSISDDELTEVTRITTRICIPMVWLDRRPAPPARRQRAADHQDAEALGSELAPLPL